MKTSLTILFSCFLLTSAISQVGIGTTSPNAQLDIKATSQSTPLNTDGILIPKIDEFPVTSPTSAQDGMLVFVTGGGTPSRGFYYWDQGTTSWVLLTGGGGTSEWTDQGNYLVPADGNIEDVTIGGADNANSKLTVVSEKSIGAYIDAQNIQNTKLTGIANITTNSSSNPTAQTLGLEQIISNGNDGTLKGISTNLINASNAELVGNENVLSSNGSGNQSGSINTISNSGDGILKGTVNNITNTGEATQTGTENNLNGGGEVIRIGTANNLFGSSNGPEYGTNTSINTVGNAISPHHGSVVTLSGNGGGERFGYSAYLQGGGNGNRYGTETQISNGGTGIHYGNYNLLSGAGSGNKYGSYSFLVPTAGGTHYGVYAEATKSGSYAGYFLGRLSVGTTATDNYILPASRGTNGQIMQTDASGNVSWVTLASGSEWTDNGTFLSPADGDTEDVTIGGADNVNSRLTVRSDKQIGGLFTNTTQRNGFTLGVNTYLNNTHTTSGSYSVGIYNDIVNDGLGFGIGQWNYVRGTSSNSLYGNFSRLAGTGSASQFGTRNDINGTGDGQQSGTYNYVSNTGDGVHYGTFSTLFGNGTGIHYGGYHTLSGSGSGNQYGLYQTITNSGDGEHYGMSSSLNGSGNGIKTGIRNTLSGSGTGNQLGLWNQLYGSGSGTNTAILNFLTGTGTGPQVGINQSLSNNNNNSHHGMLNNLYGTGSGNHVGVQNSLYGSGTGDQTGVNNSISNSGNGNHTGIFNSFDGTGSGVHTGTSNFFLGMATGIQVGVSNYIDVSGDNIHYGVNNILRGSGSGNKYGSYTSIIPTAGGTHYGVYSDVLKSGSFAGYFLGNVAIGTNTVNTYTFPASRGANGQIMQTDGVGNLSWITPVTSDTSPAWYDGGTTTNATTTSSNIYRSGSIGIGINNPASPLHIVNTNSQEVIQSSFTNTTNNISTRNLLLTSTTNANNNDMTGFSNSVLATEATATTNINGVNNFLNNASLTGTTAGTTNNLTVTGTGQALALSNNIVSTGSGLVIGLSNNIQVGNGTHFGIQTLFTPNGASTADVYGTYIEIPSTLSSGTHYGVYSSATKTGSYAGYFLGRFSIGTTTSNNYVFPDSRGSNGQVMISNGSGILSWVDGDSLGVQKIDDLSDGKSDSDGSNDGSSIFLGLSAGGGDDSSNNRNVGIGYYASFSNQTGEENVAIGYEARHLSVSGNGNVAIGAYAGYNNWGNDNVAIGRGSGPSGYDTASDNISIGALAGSGLGVMGPNIPTGNILIGKGANPFSLSGSNQMNIGDFLFANTIYGSSVGGYYSGNMGIGYNNPTSTLHVGGDIRMDFPSNGNYWRRYIDAVNDYNFEYNGTLRSYIQDTDGSYNIFSDRRLKKNIRAMNSETALKVLQLNPVNYTYKTDETQTNQYGFIAQEVKKLFPELVNEKNTNNEEYLSLNYQAFGVLAIKTIQEQQKEIEILKEEITELKKLEERIKKLEMN